MAGDEAGETVYLPRNRFGGDRQIYHTERDCPHLDTAANVSERELDKLFEEFRECQRCAGGEIPKGSTGGGHYQSLKAAATADSGEGGDA